MSELTKMFTVASDDEDGDGLCDLLFYKAVGAFTEEEMNAIAEDPLVNKFMGGHAILINLSGTRGSELILTQDIFKYAVIRLGEPTNDAMLLYMAPGSKVQTINIEDEYYSCTLPHKVIVGCSECINIETKKSCKVKRLDIDTESCDNIIPEDVVAQLKSRKSVIAGFTYVSPRLTTPEHFMKTYRSVDEHDFSVVEERSDSIRQGLKERSRHSKFKLLACPTCLIQTVCSGTHRYSTPNSKYCSGPYAETTEEAVAKIINDSIVPFTDKQLMFLALNSGMLDKKYRRRIYWTTFRYVSGVGLTFGLSRYLTGEYVPFKSFKEANAFLRGHRDTIHEPSSRKERLTPELKATLLELSRHWSSPGWGSCNRTYSETLGIEYNRYSNQWNMRFRYSSGWSVSKGYLPWVHYQSVTAGNLIDVYRAYESYSSLTKTNHVHGYKSRYW